MPLCFAYGSNMDRVAMAARCPHSKALGVARLQRHRFAIMPEGYANVVRDPSSTVYGVLWDVSLADMRALDSYEEVGRGLYRKVIQPVLRETGGGARALVYMGQGAGARPKPGYLEKVLAAARDWQLPERYIRELEGHAVGRPMAPKPPVAQSAHIRPALDESAAIGEAAAPGVRRVRPRYATPFDRRN